MENLATICIATVLLTMSATSLANSTIDVPLSEDSSTDLASTTDVTSITMMDSTSPSNNLSTVVDDTTSKIFSIKYSILQEKIPKLMADLIVKNNFQYNIRTQDVVNVLDLEHVTFSHLTTLLEDLDIAVERINFREAFQTFDLSVIEVLRLVVTNIPNAKSATQAILKNFGIDPTEYIWITNFENDESMFDLLESGNYTVDGVNYALELASMTRDDVLNLLRPTLLSKINQKQIVNMLELMSRYNLTQTLNSIFGILNVTGSHFESDVVFGRILSNLTDILNRDIVIASAVQPNEVVTILDVQSKWGNLDDFVAMSLSNIRNSSLLYQVQSIRNDTLFSIITIGVDLDNYLLKADNYSVGKYGNCQCVAEADGEFYLEDVTDLVLQDDAIMGNVNGSSCNLGSPLICSELLYGLSITNRADRQKFLTFKPKLIPPPPVHNGTTINTVILTTSDIISITDSASRLSVNFLLLTCLLWQLI